MLSKKHKQINDFLIIIVLGLAVFPFFSMVSDTAIQLFKQNKFEEALPLFQEQFNINPLDPTVCYYYGICLVETNRFGKIASTCLERSLNGNSPNDANFYLAKNEHATNIFQRAISNYSKFKESATRKEIKSYNIDGLLDLCKRSINPYPPVRPMPEFANNVFNNAAIQDVPNLTSMGTDTTTSVETNETYEEKPPEIPILLNDAAINFMLTSEIFYTRFSQFRTYNGKWNFIKGWNSADSLTKIALETDSLRKEYATTFSTDLKMQLSNRVVELESLMLKTKLQSVESYYKASEVELSYWKQANEEEKWRLITENDSIRQAEELRQIVQLTPEMVADTILEDDSIHADTTIAVNAEPVNEPAKTSQLVFKVQIGAYNAGIPESAKKLFKKISVLRKIDQYVDDRNYTVFTIGELTNVKDAIKLQDQIRQESVKDAFVIAIKDGKRIPLNEAQELLKKQ
jgi:tetratricopeptide (TPR) repeat protein